MIRVYGRFSEVISYSILEPAREEPRVVLLAISTVFITMGQGIVSPILPLLVQSLGKTVAMVGIVISVFAMARLVMNIPAGFLTGRIGARPVMVFGALLSAIGNLMSGAIPQYGPLVMSRIVSGMGSAFYITAAIVFVAEVSTRENRGRLMTIYQASFLFGLTLGPSIGGLTAELFGLRSPFFLVAGLSCLAVYWALTRIPSEVGRSIVMDRSTRTRNMTKSRTEPNSGFLSIGYISISLIVLATFFTRSGTLFTLWPLLGENRFELDPGGIGLMLTIPAATNLLFQPVVGFIADRLGRRTLILPVVLLFVASLLISAASPSLGLFTVAMILYGVAQAVESPVANAYVTDIAPRHQRAVALSVMRTFGDAGAVVGAPLLGLISDLTSITWGLVVNAVLMLIAGIPFLVTYRETHPTSRQESSS